MSTPPAPDVEHLISSAFGVLALLKDELKSAGYSLAIDGERKLVFDALAQHGSYLSLIEIEQEQLDPLKLLSWLGGSTIKGLEKIDNFFQHHVILDALIAALKLVLYEETDGQARLSDEDVELLKRMLMAEIQGKCEHGIGFNGLYIAFHFARAMFKQPKS